MPKQPKPHEPEHESHSSRKQKNSRKPEKIITFWTVCNRCKIYSELVRASHLNKTLPCPICGQHFIATKIIQEIINGSPSVQSTSEKAQAIHFRYFCSSQKHMFLSNEYSLSLTRFNPSRV